MFIIGLVEEYILPVTSLCCPLFKDPFFADTVFCAKALPIYCPHFAKLNECYFLRLVWIAHFGFHIAQAGQRQFREASLGLTQWQFKRVATRLAVDSGSADDSGESNRGYSMFSGSEFQRICESKGLKFLLMYIAGECRSLVSGDESVTMHRTTRVYLGPNTVQSLRKI